MASNHLLVPTAAGHRLSVPATLACMTTHVLLEKEQWFEKEIAFVARYLLPGMTAIDIGANLGVYTMIMADAVTATGQVIAYEPGSDNRQHLQRSVALNQLGNTRILPQALADQRCTGWLQLGESGELNQLTDNAATQTGIEPVDITTLDYEAHTFDWPDVDFLKIDAEGKEDAIIRGGTEFFGRYSPLVMYELKQGGASNDQLCTLMQHLGYESFRLLGDASLLVPVEHGETPDPFELNLFAARNTLVAALHQRGLLAISDANARLSAAETASALGCYTALPFAQTLEISADDIARCPFGTALTAYAAYRFLPLQHAPDRRFALLRSAYEQLSDYCTMHTCPAALASLARIAADFGQRKAMLNALITLNELDNVELTQPFFPACARFEGMHFDDAFGWFRAAGAEQFELAASFSAYHGCDIERMQALAEIEPACTEILRRLILRTLLNHRTLDPALPLLERLRQLPNPCMQAWETALFRLNASLSEKSLDPA